MAAALLMAGFVAVVGAASYVVLSAVSASGSHVSTVHTCAPANSTLCKQVQNSTGASAVRMIALGPAFG